jgi:hypothetical protein
MIEAAAVHRVEVTFVGRPPTRQIEHASGVSDVEANGQMVRCLVYGSFQPFLEAVRGYEVINLTAIRAPEPLDDDRVATDEQVSPTHTRRTT